MPLPRAERAALLCLVDVRCKHGVGALYVAHLVGAVYVAHLCSTSM